jgi:hypothetical protein
VGQPVASHYTSSGLRHPGFFLSGVVPNKLIKYKDNFILSDLHDILEFYFNLQVKLKFSPAALY